MPIFAIPPAEGKIPFLAPRLVLAVALITGSALGAPANTTKTFNLPADLAENSLPKFAEQSGFEVVFATETVGKVRTNAVQGQLTAREAMDRLLMRTGLVAAQNPTTGALLVSRAPNGQRAAQRTASDRPTRQSAQAAPAPARNPVGRAVSPSTNSSDPGSGANEEETTVLSPFVVNSERDTGYQATSTLAGTRINTPLEDIGAAISVYTSDFLNDISATDHNELLIYATGMEASGAQGNLSGLTANVENTATLTTREDPEGGAGFGVAIRARGLSVPSRTRGFFITDIPSDNYNVERVTVNRGPNSILFGVGNPGGIIDSSLMRANLNRNRNKVLFRYGDNDSIRTSVDFNRVLIKGKLAGRLAALYHREEYDQRPAFEEKRRLYGTVTYEPFRSTSIRAHFETGRGRANRVHTVPPRNSLAVWLAEGRQPFDWTFYDDPARNPNARTQNVQNLVPPPLNPTEFGDRIVMVTASPSGGGVTGFSNRIRLVAPNAAIVHPVFNRDGAADNFQFVTSRNIADMPATWWPGGVEPPATRGATFSDYSAFPWNKKQLYTSESQPNTFNTFNIAIEQRAWRDRLGIELAYDRQRFHMQQFTGGEPTLAVGVDANVFLPTGQPNPNLGRPYVTHGGLIERYGYYYREAMRATGYVKYDFAELGPRWTRWLGRHNVTLLAEQNAYDRNRGGTNLSVDGPAAQQANPDLLSTPRQFRAITYIGPSLIGNNNPPRFEQISAPRPAPGTTFPTAYYDPATDSIITGTSTLVDWVQQGSAIRDVVKSVGVAGQSYWLQDHLVTLIGWRQDRDYFIQEQLVTKRNPTRTGPNDGGTVRFNRDEFGFPNTPPLLASNEIVTYSGVLKWPTRLIPLPAGINLGGFYTESDNFTPSGGRFDTYGKPLPPPTGSTEEYGINLSAFDGKLSIRVNRFKTSILNQGIISGGLPTAIAETGITQTVDAWMREANRNPDNVPFMNAAIERLMSPLPGDYLEYRNFRVSGTAPNLTTTFDRPQASDTTDFVARGTEVNVVYNPTRNWRIMTNVTRAKTVQTNLYPITKAFLELITPVVESSVTDPVTGVTVPFKDIPKGGYPEGFGPANPPAANIQRFGQWLNSNIVFPLAAFRATEGLATPEQRKWRVNIVANYEVGPGSPFESALKGWGIGAGYRWQSKVAIGYPSSIDENGVAQFEIGNPYWGPAETNVDAWITYSRRIWKDRINWKAQLSVKNLIGGTDLIPVRAQPWGEVAVYRIPPEKRWYLTNTFEF